MYNFKISELIFYEIRISNKENLLLHCFLNIKCENRVTISIHMYSQFIFNQIFTQFKCKNTYTHCHSLNFTQSL